MNYLVLEADSSDSLKTLPESVEYIQYSWRLEL